MTKAGLEQAGPYGPGEPGDPTLPIEAAKRGNQAGLRRMAVRSVIMKYLWQDGSVGLSSGPLLELLISSELKSRPVVPNSTLGPR